MPVGLEAHCERILDEVVSLSQKIRRSALAYTNRHNLSISDRFRFQLETIRTSADAILETLTKASLTNDALDDRIINWLFSGELLLCVDKLKEMDCMLRPTGQNFLGLTSARPVRPAEDRLGTTMALLNRHISLFHFLLTPDVWNRKGHHHQPLQPDALPISKDTRDNPELSNVTTSGRNNGGPSHAYQSLQRPKRSFEQKLDAVSRWLSGLDCTEKHNQTLQLRQEGTCTWFPKTDVYTKWRTGDESQFLWLRGKAGCGKSVLTASTIEYLTNTLGDGEVLVFFYCDFRNERSTSPAELMRSLLCQFFRHLCDWGIDPMNFPNKILDAKCKGTLTLNDLDKLRDLVMRATLFFPRYPIIVIDALDECVDIERLARALVPFKRADVRLLVTSRPDQTIMDSLMGFQSLFLDSMTEEMAGDITLHVTREIDSHGRLRSAGPDLKEEIQVKLNEKADCRFRWVQCQLDALKRCTSKQELREALDELPTELEAAYERILGEIDERKSEGRMARRVLVCLSVSFEPLRLAQIVGGVSVDEEQMGARETQSLGRALVHALSSLVSHYEETDVLSFSHFSVKEYLLSRAALPTYHIILHVAHAEVAQMCMQYVSYLLKQTPIRGNAGLLLQSFPLLSYILSHSFDHLVHVEPESTIALEALRSLGADVRHHPSHWERLCELREEVLGLVYPSWPSKRHDFIPYILIAYCSSGLLRSFFSGDHPPKPRAGTNPLVYAADLRRTEHAMVLLTCGANVNMRGFVVDDSHHALPLDIAIDLGDHELVGALLQRGCIVTPEVLSTAICMPWCSTRVLVKLMQTEEFTEWAREIGHETLYRRVFNSARPNAGDSRQTDEDHVALARILRQIGQDLSPRSRFGAELIERSIHAAHTSMLELLLPADQPPPSRFLLAASTGDTSETVSVVCFLLRKGVDVHATSDGRRDTALHLAAMCPWEPRRLELVEMLVNAGCNPLARNSEDETVFQVAIRRGYVSLVDFLLSCRISPPSPDTLQTELTKCSPPEIIEFIIRNDADVHCTSSNGDTMLHLSIAAYDEPTCLHLIKCFIEAGCTPTTANSKGQTVLDVAIGRDYTSVVVLLLSHDVSCPPDILPIVLQKRWDPLVVEHLILKGANVHFRSNGGNTVLHLAISHYRQSACLALIKMFIEAGCDPNTPNGRGDTAIVTVIKCEYTSVAQLLLSFNVPCPPDILPIALQNCSTPEMVKFLVQKGADVHSITCDGNTVLHLVIAKYSEAACLDLVRKFIEVGCHPAANLAGKTVLEAAIERRYILVVKLLHSCYPLLPPDILPIALRNHCAVEMAEFLVQKGANVHSRTSDGRTILHLAITDYAESECLGLVRCFVEVGCNPATSDFHGRTVFDLAIERGCTSVMEFLLSCHVSVPPDVLPVELQKHSDPRIVEFLVRNGADVHCTTSSGDTILHLAVTEYAKFECLDLVERFIEAGCNPTISNSEGRTVLDVAIRRGYISVVDFLLSCTVSVPPNILPIELRKHSSPRVIEFMIRNGADIHSTTSNGDGVLHLAITEYAEPTSLDLIKRFIEAGCIPSAYNSKGQAVLDIAISRGYTSVVEILLLSYHVPFRPDVLSTALQKRFTRILTPRVVEYLIRNGADVRLTTSDGNTVLHLAVMGYPEPWCLDLVRRFIEAGSNPSTSNSAGKTVLDIAMKRGYTLVAEYLLSCNVTPIPQALSDVLLKALQQRYSPKIIQLLISKAADDCVVMPKPSQWDAVLRVAYARYTGSDRVRVTGVLNTAREQTRMHSNLGDRIRAGRDEE